MLVFDLDDTLYLERDFAFSGYAAAGRHLASEHGIDGEAFAARCCELFEAGERKRIFDRALSQQGLSPDNDIMTALVEVYRNHHPDITLCRDARDYLPQHSGPFGLITDGLEATQIRKIDALRLGNWIKTILPTGRWGTEFAKPHPRAFIEIEKLATTRCVYVADNPAKDFVTPKARGWLTVAILRDGRVHTALAPDAAHQADATITSLDDLDAVLARFGLH